MFQFFTSIALFKKASRISKYETRNSFLFDRLSICLIKPTWVWPSFSLAFALEAVGPSCPRTLEARTRSFGVTLSGLHFRFLRSWPARPPRPSLCWGCHGDGGHNVDAADRARTLCYRQELASVWLGSQVVSGINVVMLSRNNHWHLWVHCHHLPTGMGYWHKRMADLVTPASGECMEDIAEKQMEVGRTFSDPPRTWTQDVPAFPRSRQPVNSTIIAWTKNSGVYF